MSFKALTSLLFAFSAVVVNAAVVEKRVTCATGQTTANAACCKLFPILADLQGADLLNGECDDAAHAALRIAFHDAIGFSRSSSIGGGADGSIVVFNATETKFHGNGGIDDILDIFGDNIHAHPEISPGDYLQFANAVGLTNCPGAPRLKFLLGRPAPKAAAAGPNGGVPEPFDSVTSILARFADAGFSPAEVVALLASHSTAGADTVEPSRPGSAFDSTHDVFDTQFFIETALRGTNFPTSGVAQGEVSSSVQGTLRLQSDHDIARDSRTACIWQGFVNNQASMASAFKAAMEKLAVVGQNTATLIDCSDVIPAAKPVTGTPHFPPTLSNANVEQACATKSFPTLTTLPGPATSVPPIDQD